MMANESDRTQAGGRPGPGREGASGPVAHTGEGGGAAPVEPPGGVPIQVDREEVVVPLGLLADGALTVSQIRQLVSPPIAADRDVFEIVPGGLDRKIENEESVVLREWMRFFSAPRTINPGLVG